MRHSSRPLRSLPAAGLVAAAALAGACGASPPGPDATAGGAAAGRPVEIESPAGPGSGEPALAVRDGVVFLSWLEPAGDGATALRMATRRDGRWSDPVTIASRPDFFVNWADFPSLRPLSDGALAAHWLQKSGEGAYAYDVKVSLSRDGGASWSEPVSPHRDGTETEHGFVSMLDLGGGRLGVAWLDGRNFQPAGDGHDANGDPDGHGPPTAEMMLMWSVLEDGAFRPETVLDPRVCECCQTDAALTARGVFLAYRDRSEGEIRDVSAVRSEGDGWSAPAGVHDDGWEIEGCPVNGPAVAADGDRVAVAWFTAAGGEGRVLAAFSADGGGRFSAPVRVDEGRGMGRTDLVALDGGAVLVCWLEGSEEKGAEVRARVVRPDGSMDAGITVARTGAARASGFPRAVRDGGEILFAWTDTSSKPARVRLAALDE